MNNPKRKSTGNAVGQAPEGTNRGFLQRPWARSPASFEHRIDAVASQISGKTVLDVGCASGFGREDWMHVGLRRHAARVTGIDLDADRINEIREAGFDVIASSAESFATAETFDVVFAGELIEHLECPETFLRNAHRALKPGGELILTTPNPFAVPNFVYRLRGKALVNRDHVAWYCEDTISQLLERLGFRDVQVSYVSHPDVGNAIRRALVRLVRYPLPPVLRWGTMLVVATPSE